MQLTENGDRQPGNEPEEAPETPTDEPKPAPVQDPPAEPGRAPYVVAHPGGRANSESARHE